MLKVGRHVHTYTERIHGVFTASRHRRDYCDCRDFARGIAGNVRNGKWNLSEDGDFFHLGFLTRTEHGRILETLFPLFFLVGYT